MAISSPLSFAGLDAQLDSLKDSLQAVAHQNDICKLVFDENNKKTFLPNHVKPTFYRYAFVKGIDKDLLRTLVLVGVVSAFEKFVKVLVNDVLRHFQSQHSSFLSLPQDFRDNYVSAACGILSHRPSGSVRGVRVDFVAIERSLKECLAGLSPYSLVGDAVTAEMGGPTSGTIDRILSKLGISSAFDHVLGQELVTTSWRAHGDSGPATKAAQVFVDQAVGTRNDIIHGLTSVVLNDEEILDFLESFRAISAGILSSVDKKV